MDSAHLAQWRGLRVTLMALHRIVGIGRLNRQLLLPGVDARERRIVMANESVVVMGLIVAGLLVTSPMILIADAPAGSEGLAGGSSPTKAVIRGGLAVLLTSTLWLWFRGLRSS